MKIKQQNLWHALDTDAVTAALRTDCAKGLSGKEAAFRRVKRGENAVWRVQHTPGWELARGEFFDLPGILLIITALLSAVFNDSEEAVILIGILVTSAAIRTAANMVAHRIFEEAARANIPHASVIREGRMRTLPADAVVPGDILLLKVGSPVVADVRIVSGEVVVTEIGVTDNRDPQRKSAAFVLPEHTPCEERVNILFAGSTVISGSGRGVVVGSGEETYIFARRGHINIPAGENLPILSRLSGWCRNVSLVMIAAVLLISLGGAFFGQKDLSLDSLFLSALALAVASMSDFLCVIAPLLIANAVRLLHTASKGGTILRAADSVERFANARCLILSDPRLLSSENIFLHGAFVDGHDATIDERPTEILQLIALSLLCRCGSVNSVSAGGECQRNSETTEKIRTLFKSFDDTLHASLSLPPVTEIAQNNRLYTAMISGSDGPEAYVCGSLAEVLSCCSQIEADGHAVTLTPQLREKLLKKAHILEHSSITTVCIARRLSPYTTLSRPSVLQMDMTLMGYFAIANPIETDLVRLAERCRIGGIRIVILTDRSDGSCIPAVEAGILSPDVPMLTDEEQLANCFSNGLHSGAPFENVCVFVQNKLSRAKIVQKITECIPETVYVGNKLQDIPLFEYVSASVAAASRFKVSPQCMFSAADASVQLDTDLPSAGAADAIRVIGACRSAFLRLRGITEYLLSTQSMRLAVMIAAAFFDIPMLTSVQLLWWGVILDLMGLLTFAFLHRDDNALAQKRELLHLPSFGRGIVFPIISGVLIGLLLSLIAVLSLHFFSLADPASVVYIGGVLSSLMFLVSSCSDSKTHSMRVSAVGILYGTLLLMTVLISSLHADLLVCLFALVPPSMVPLLRFLYRRADKETTR